MISNVPTEGEEKHCVLCQMVHGSCQEMLPMMTHGTAGPLQLARIATYDRECYQSCLYQLPTISKLMSQLMLIVPEVCVNLMLPGAFIQ
jgi:hypothetical protein